MKCQACDGKGLVSIGKTFFATGEAETYEPCQECGGSGIVSCCDAAGSAEVVNPPKAAFCAACGARQEYGRIRCLDCGKPLVFSAYHDRRWPERMCDCCGKPYRGPAVYCSLACAVADA